MKKITKFDVNPNDCLAVVMTDGSDGCGKVVGFALAENKQKLVAIQEEDLFDMLDLFIGEEIPEDVSIDYMTLNEFNLSYNDSMSLCFEGISLIE